MAAQLQSNKDAPVRISQYHLNVTSIEAQKKFRVDALGGTAMKFGPDNVDMIKRWHRVEASVDFSPETRTRPER